MSKETTPPRWYGVDPKIWNTTWIRHGTPSEQILALYLWTCPQRTSSGLFSVNKGVICETLGWSSRRLRRAWRGLIDSHFLMEWGDGYIEIPEAYIKYPRPGVVRAAISAPVRREVLERDQATCQVCGSTDRPEIDHIVPLTRGGDDRISNLRVLCKPCNLSKRDKLDSEWLGTDV